jgi:hypothetical protein
MQHPKGEVAARLFAAALIAGFVFSQLLASWHEAGVRHVRCAEHGEMVDVEASHGPAFNDGRATGTTVEGAETATPSEHEHCAVALALRGSAQVQVVRAAVRLVAPPMAVRPAVDPAPRPGRAFVLASAPKTSPPSA